MLVSGSLRLPATDAVYVVLMKGDFAFEPSVGLSGREPPGMSSLKRGLSRELLEPDLKSDADRCCGGVLNPSPG